MSERVDWWGVQIGTDVMLIEAKSQAEARRRGFEAVGAKVEKVSKDDIVKLMSAGAQILKRPAQLELEPEPAP